MKFLILILFMSMFLATRAQKNIISEDSIIKKWELCTLNIETSTSAFFYFDLIEKQAKGNLSQSEKDQQFMELYKTKMGVSGTAIFLKYNNIHFLITARHVLEDLNLHTSGIPYSQLFFPENYNNFTPDKVIPTSLYLMPLDTSSHSGNFIFSPKNIDIGIAALDAYDYQIRISNIPKILRERGYQPIDIDAIDTNYQPKVNDLTYSIGFPSISNYGTKSSLDTFQVFQSNNITIPLISKGKILDAKKMFPFFISDDFVYFGNSGGPIVHNNKLVGIAHALNVEDREVVGTQLKKYKFLNGNQFIKSTYILPLLRELVAKIKLNKLIPR